MADPMPALFVSHGAPTLLFEDGPARSFLAGYGAQLDRPRAIIVLSAHYDHPGATRITTSLQPPTIHDFGAGFGPALHAFQYPAPGDPTLAGRLASMLEDAGFETKLDPRRGLDHGAWVPLALMYPAADIPIVQVSIDSARTPERHERLGATLAPLRRKGVLIIGSGSATHNLGEFFGQAHDAPAPDWVTAFGEWSAAAVTEGRFADLRDYLKLGPQAARNHPTPEHYLPLFCAIGAGGGANGVRVHTSHTYGVLAMDVFAFGG